MAFREELPYDEGLDNTLAFFNEGYLYITNRRKRFNRDMFKTRILGGKQVICMAGKEAAEAFYDNDKFKRHGAAPNKVLNTLFGQDGVQTLDGEEHAHRKSLFMNFMTKESLEEIGDLVEDEWMKSLNEWAKQNNIVLYEEVKQILTIAISKWVGVPLDEVDIESFSKELGNMYESAEKIGMKHFKGKHARNKNEKWLEKLIGKIRSGEVTVDEERPFYKIAFHKDLEGELLATHTAAVEVLNLLRPTVAISVYIVLSALALHEFPKEVDELRNGDKTYNKMFVQEVRRYYPFFPVAPAIVKNDFFWGGHDFKKGTLVLLDLYGTNHHPELWENPNDFSPERFTSWDKSPFDLIPQGGGDYLTGHRCAGEWLTIAVMQRALDLLVNKMSYDVAEQDLSLSMKEMPSVPKSGFIIQNVQKVE